MAVSITPTIGFNAVETLVTGVDGATSPSVSHNKFNIPSVTHNANSTAPVTMASYRTYTLVAGAVTIDLRALLGVGDESQDADGLKLQTIVIRNPSGNNAITVTTGATNGFPLFGGTNSVIIPADSELAFHVPEGLVNVSATDKDIDVSGTGTEKFDMGICLG